jgi:hypothetical protein
MIMDSSLLKFIYIMFFQCVACLRTHTPTHTPTHNTYKYYFFSNIYIYFKQLKVRRRLFLLYNEKHGRL